MNETRTPASVVAGIDGSRPAINAALWAVDEAVSRSVPLRLVYVTKATHPSADAYYEDMHHGEESLRAAQAAVESTGQAVKIETAIVSGPPAPALIVESRAAEMICVGSVGIGRYARSILGSTATELAEKAHCPVAIIRPQDDEEPPPDINWIIVAVHGTPDEDPVVEAAIEEAALRRAPVLALGDRRDRDTLDVKVRELNRRHPDVHIYPVVDKADVARFLKKYDERVQLAVIGASRVGELARILGPYGRSRLRHPGSSVLVVRG